MTNQFPVLRSLLMGNDPILISEAARLCGEFRRVELIQTLEKCALESGYYAKASALFSLHQLDAETATQVAAIILNHPGVPDDFYWYCSRAVRTSAAVVLAWANNPEGITFLEKKIKEKDPVVTRWLAPTLLMKKTPSHLRHLLTLGCLVDLGEMKAYSSPPYSEPGQLCLLCEALGQHEDSGAIDILKFYSLFHSRFVRISATRGLSRKIGPAQTLSFLEEKPAAEKTPSDDIEQAALRGDAETLLGYKEGNWGNFERFQAVDRLDRIGHGRDAVAFLSDPWAPVRQRAIEALASYPEGPGLIRQHMDKETTPRVLAAGEASKRRESNS